MSGGERAARRAASRRRRVLWVGDAPGGHYQEALHDWMVAHRLPSSGVIVASVRHDDVCALIQHGRPCNCKPEIAVEEVP